MWEILCDVHVVKAAEKLLISKGLICFYSLANGVQLCHNGIFLGGMHPCDSGHVLSSLEVLQKIV